jgi:D-xylose transport system substrate-binding protein
MVNDLSVIMVISSHGPGFRCSDALVAFAPSGREERTMRTKMFALAVVGVLTAGSMVACSDDGSSDTPGTSAAGTTGGGNSAGKIGVILPDTTSSQRWKTDDPKFLKAAFEAKGVQADIENANGDKTQFVSIGEKMIASGVKVLIVVSLDATSGKTVLDKANAAGIPTIDYDRQTLNGGAKYYVSFNNVTVGQLQGQGLVKCLSTHTYAKAPIVADLNGSPTDNNASQFKTGYESVLQPKYDAGTYRKGPDQSVDDWNAPAGGIIFQQMMDQTNNQIDGVLAANDGLAGAAISVLRHNKLNGKVPVTGQDATVAGLQNILIGDQCMTVYKPIKEEADAAADLAFQLYKGDKNVKLSDRVKDPESGVYIQSKLLTPIAITKSNIGRVISDGFVKRSEICTAAFAQACTDAGL